MDYSAEEIRDLFHINPKRFDKPLASAGNDVFKSMVAIAYCCVKYVYCFPWLRKSILGVIIII